MVRLRRPNPSRPRQSEQLEGYEGIENVAMFCVYFFFFPMTYYTIDYLYNRSRNFRIEENPPVLG